MAVGGSALLHVDVDVDVGAGLEARFLSASRGLVPAGASACTSCGLAALRARGRLPAAKVRSTAAACRCLFLCWLPYAAGVVQQEDGAALPADTASGVESAKDRTMYAVSA